MNGDTPIVCASIELPDTGSRRLAPIAYLVKPFALPDLQHAISRALSNGSGNRARVAVGPLVAEITTDSVARLSLREGEPVVASFKATAARLLPLA